VIAAEARGKKATANELGIDQVVFRGDQMTVKRQGKEVMNLRFTVDPAQKPKAMDWINESQKSAPPLPGIYAIEGDELRLCFPMLPRGRCAPHA
jgi:uncharacterized protein (TIGR03067 family)